MDHLHTLLERQIKRAAKKGIDLKKDLPEFIEQINSAYNQFDSDRAMLERIMEVSSEELIQASSEMRAVFQAFPDIFIRTDISGKILDFKAECLERFVPNAITLMGSQIQELFGSEVGGIIEKGIHEVKRTKALVCIEFTAELNNIDHYYEARLAAVLEKQIIFIIRDITERKFFEEALEQQRSFLRQVIDVNPNYIYAKDQNGHFTLVNKAFAEIYGTTAETLIGKTDAEFNHNIEEVENFRKADKIVLDSGIEKFIAEESTTDSNGKIRYLQTVKRPILDSNGNSHQILGVSIDITERKNTEQQNAFLEIKLRQSQKMEAIGRLTGGIAHDFNNILFSILGYSQLAVKKNDRKAEVDNELHQVIIAAKRAIELVKQILAFSRMSEKQLLIVDLNTVVKEVQLLLRGSLPSNIEIVDNLSANPMNVMADPSQLHQVLMNLCTNAFHAMREIDGQLHISTDVETIYQNRAASVGELKSGKYVKLTVRDTGHGISPEVKERIFDPFYTTKDVGEGTGLGLAVIHGVVNDHGGCIVVDSTVGVGTAFEVYLPYTEGLEAVASDQKNTNLSGNERVLLVDDEEPLVKLGQQMLEELGYSVTTATSSIEALKIFEKSPTGFDLVITDQTMPKMKGLKLAQAILLIRPEMPIILCTGYSEKFSPQQAIDIGCRECLMKPVPLNEFASVVRRILDDSNSLSII